MFQRGACIMFSNGFSNERPDLLSIQIRLLIHPLCELLAMINNVLVAIKYLC
jgi:hypothetical protein